MDPCGDETVLKVNIFIVVYTCDKVAYNYIHTLVHVKLVK